MLYQFMFDHPFCKHPMTCFLYFVIPANHVLHARDLYDHFGFVIKLI